MRSDRSIALDATVDVTLLRRCAQCAHPHPLACTPPADARWCPRCQAPAAAPVVNRGRAIAILRGLWLRIGVLFFRIGARLRRISEG